MIDLRNFWCPRCMEWVASADISTRHIHYGCGEKCQYIKFCPDIFKGDVEKVVVEQDF